MKIILSRKGFDAACGGAASPILPDGTLLSLPIPYVDAPVCYDDLTFGDHAVGDLVEDLTVGRIKRDQRAHLDPDLAPATLPREPGWRPLFGQAGGSQTHLARCGVSSGDLFVFFGYFRQVERHAGRWRYVRQAPHLHVIFGWLQVDHLLRPNEQPADVPDWACYHPHAQRAFPNNALYVARERLSLGDEKTQTAGGGVIPRFEPRHCLTAPGYGRSTWLLPSWFFPDERSSLTYHADMRRWQQHEDGVLLRSAAQGQEFVFDTDEYPEALAWVRSLLSVTPTTE